MNKPKVLVVDDATVVHDEVREHLDGQIDLYTATTTMEAREHLHGHEDFALVALDGIFPKTPGGKDDEEGPGLLRVIRDTYHYSGPIVAISSTKGMRAKMMQGGCDFQSTKDKLTETIVDILHLEPH